MEYINNLQGPYFYWPLSSCLFLLLLCHALAVSSWAMLIWQSSEQEAATDRRQIKRWPYIMHLTSFHNLMHQITQIYKTVIVQKLHHPMQLHYTALKTRMHMLHKESVNMVTVTCANVLLHWPTKISTVSSLRQDTVMQWNHMNITLFEKCYHCNGHSSATPDTNLNH